MESRNPRDEENISSLNPDDQDSVRLATAVRRILAAESIHRGELDEDPFLVEGSVEEFIERQKQKR